MPDRSAQDGFDSSRIDGVEEVPACGGGFEQGA
jgi:hypothetical protein